MTSPSSTAPELAEYSGSWVLNPTKTSIEFHTKAMWVLKVKGAAKALEGGGSVTPDGAVSGKFVVDATSVDTGNKKRDAHLQTADFFEADKYPTFEFALTNVSPAGPGKVEVKGNLTIHGETKPLTMVADVTASGASAVVATEVDIDRSQWGIAWAKMGAGLANRVVISAHFDKA